MLAVLIVSAATAAIAGPAAADPADVLGVSVRLDTPGAATPTAPEHADHPGLAMISAMVTWASLEPVEGQFDWSTLDADVADARTGGYRILLRIMTGRLSPSWLATDGAATIDLLGTDISAFDYCDRLEIALPWDPVLRAKYTDLMTEVGTWLQEPDGAGGTKGDHVFAIPVAMPSFQGTEMNLGYGTNVTCPSGTDGAGSNLAASNQAAWDAVAPLAQRQALVEQAWVDAIDIHMATLPTGVDSLLAYGAVFGDAQASALRLAQTQVPRYPDRLWSMYTNLQPKVRSDGSLGTYREWCTACHDVMMSVTAEHGLLGFQTAGVRINDTSAKFHAAVEDGLATYGMRFLETQPLNVDSYYGYLATDPGNVQSRILATDHQRATSTTVTCGAVSIGATSTCTATVLDGAGAPITPGGAATIAWSASVGSLDAPRCTPVGAGASASCSVTYTPASVGADAVTAVYDGDSNHVGSAGSAAVSVGARPTSTVVSCDASVRIGESAHCSATVRDTGTGTPSDPAGSVTWASAEGSFDAGACTLIPAGGGAASCAVTYTPAAPGSKTLSASYAGDGVHGSSGGGATVTVRLRTTSVTVTCATPVPVGLPATCTASVADTDGGVAVQPSGTVGWTSGASGTFSAASCSLVGASCSVTYTPSAAGSHGITGSYAGDGSHAAGSGAAQLTATKRSTTTSVSCGTTVVVGSPTTCTATVTDTSGGTATTPGGSGTVSWSSSAPGTFAPATCSPTGAGTTASCSVAFTPTTAGTRTVTGVFAGDALHTGSSAAPFSVTATVPPDTTGPTVTITAPSGATVPKNKAFVLQATATDPSGVASVAFAVGSTVLCTDTTAPYTCSWKVPAKVNVSYAITMTGRDTHGYATSVTKTVKAV